MKLVAGLLVVVTVYGCGSAEIMVDPMDTVKSRKSKIKVKEPEKPIVDTTRKDPIKKDPIIDKPVIPIPGSVPIPQPTIEQPPVPIFSVELLKPLKLELPPDPILREELDPSRYNPEKPFEERWPDVIIKVQRALEEGRK